jgi:hypothetical protein
MTISRCRGGRNRRRVGYRAETADPAGADRRPGRRRRRHAGCAARVAGNRGGNPDPVARAAVRVGAAWSHRTARSTWIAREGGATSGRDGPTRELSAAPGRGRGFRLRSGCRSLSQTTPARVSSCSSLPWRPAPPSSCPRQRSTRATTADIREEDDAEPHVRGGCPRLSEERVPSSRGPAVTSGRARLLRPEAPLERSAFAGQPRRKLLAAQDPRLVGLRHSAVRRNASPSASQAPARSDQFGRVDGD